MDSGTMRVTTTTTTTKSSFGEFCSLKMLKTLADSLLVSPQPRFGVNQIDLDGSKLCEMKPHSLVIVLLNPRHDSPIECR